MSLCPKDYKPCMDDMCHGAGCIRMEGYQMLEQCQVCGGLIDEEIGEGCLCGDDDYPYDEPEQTP